eukprot:gene12991-8838_t
MNPLVQLLELELLGDNPGNYESSLLWRVRVQSAQALTEPLSVSFTWVGSSASSDFDQILDSFDVGPLSEGITEFELECDGPNPDEIPQDELLGLTVLIISLKYKNQEFIRVAYYTQVAYFDPALNEHPPVPVQKAALGRFVAMPQPAVTATPIMWLWTDTDRFWNDDASRVAMSTALPFHLRVIYLKQTFASHRKGRQRLSWTPPLQWSSTFLPCATLTVDESKGTSPCSHMVSCCLQLVGNRPTATTVVQATNDGRQSILIKYVRPMRNSYSIEVILFVPTYFGCSVTTPFDASPLIFHLSRKKNAVP